MTVVNTEIPAISGTPRQGQVLVTTNGTWTFDLDFLEYAYQWLRCDAAGANCNDISGATNSSYLQQAADVGSTIRSEVTATESATPPPGGPTIDAFPPNGAVAAINSASAGDTILLKSGAHNFFNLPASFAAPGIVVTCEPGATMLGVDTNNQDGYTFDDCLIQRSVHFSDINNSCFYIHGTSDRITLTNSILIGGGITLKLYSPPPSQATNIEVSDNDISGGGIDVSHWNGVDGLLIDHNYFHDPTFQSGSHQDGIQMVRARNFTVSRNHFKATGISGGQSQGMMIGSTVQGGDFRSIMNGVFVNNLVDHWNENKPLLLTCCDNVKVVNNTFQDHGSEYYSITVVPDHGPVSNVEIWNNIVQWVYNGVGGGVDFFDTNWHTRSGGSHGASEQTGAPGFAEAVAYELTGGAAARNYGLLRSGTPTVDLDGNARPGSAPVGLGCKI